MPPKTGDILVERGLATRAQVDKARRESDARREPLASRLLASGVPEGALVSVLSEMHGVPGVDLSRTAIDLSLLALVPRSVAEGDLILPLSDEGGRLHLAMARPSDERIVAEVRFVTGREVSPYVGVRSALAQAVQDAYDARERGEKLWCGADAGPGGSYLAVVVPGGDLLEDDRVALAGEDAADEPLGEAEVELEIVTEEPPAPEPRRAPLVLVVDDEPEIRHLVGRTLVAKGYAVEGAADGAEALEKAEALVPDLVLLDAMLPRVHGFEACRRLKSSPRTRHVPVVIMTAVYRGWRFAQDTMESYGAQEYVEKPFRLEDLLRAVEGALHAGGPRTAAGPSPAQPHLARARELVQAGDLAGAVRTLSEGVRADPYSAEARLQLGRALRAHGDQFRAMTELERAAELRPASLPALRALAALYEETGFRRKATEVLERAVAAAPDDETREALRGELLRLLP